MSLLHATEEDVRRFMGFVVVLPSGCWYWTGARSRGSGKRGQRVWYGSFRLGHRTVRAHRFASEVLGKQECPEGHDRDHKCGFSLCVNPECIEVVLKKVNGERKVERRRSHSTNGLERALEMFNAQ
jgi:hypothetical protein